MSDLAALIMAGGQSRRMKSPLSKILHRVAGRPLIHYPVAAARAAGAARVVVIAAPKDRETVESYLVGAFGRDAIRVVVQDPPRGTGDAVRVGLAALDGEAQRTLILSGDVPLIARDDVARLAAALSNETPLVLGTCRLDNPRGYGRILRDRAGRALGIREQPDLKDESEAAIDEINAGLYAVDVARLKSALASLTPNNAQGEYYLTDILPSFAQQGGVATVELSRDAVAGVNDRSQLAQVEDVMFARIAERHRQAGSSVASGARIDDAVQIGSDARIESNVFLRGNTVVGDGTSIDVGCVVTDSTLGPRVTLLPYTVVNESEIGEGCQLGPFAHTRPKSVLEADVKLGNFVETKATRMRRGAKANHLSYLGDGDVGENTNIGAGTIFCNYDGISKNKTSIGRDVFIGSDSQLVAPVSVGDGAYVATATCVTQDVPADAMAIGRVRQENKLGYAPKLRAIQAARKKK
ncbi:MAG TPA: bifunctional UDP-N-acetylglucosamine diphosphorylase/glucosamine-1-phosphate N-acetyltransferase GlmU [Polyangiaceae bacterium]|nr:bifunctional UDP-N-acetylglucosamine diphosphorylase/glucosamine-1-phosphate N-acetyltransferase GlmU [Polyangiaceae bacterium]